jgi:Rod binding domain-containing protein
MNISAPAPIVDVSTLAAEGLSSGSSPGTRTPAALAREFESVFVSLMLKEMRQSLEEGLFPGDKSDTLGGLFDMTIGQHISETSGIGLAESLEKYIATSLNAS